MKYWEMGECFACAVDIALADGVLEEEKDIPIIYFNVLILILSIYILFQ